MNNTLITGGRGLVGSQFTKKNFFKIDSSVCDLKNFNDTKKILSEYKIKYNINSIIHTAAKVGGVGANLNHKGEFFYDNITINTNLIESARLVGIENLVCFLSTCVFPDKIEYPLTENKIHLGPPHFSNDAYAYAKRMADIQIRSYREQYNLNYKSVIPTNIYGPNDNFNIENGHVIPSLIHKCFLAKKNNKDFIVWGTGKPLREFIFNKDVVTLTEWVLNNYNENEPIILSTSEEISIKDVVYIIVELFNFKGRVIFDDSKPEGQFRKPSNNDKIKQYLPNFKFTQLYEGLKQTIEWFEINYPNIKK